MSQRSPSGGHGFITLLQVAFIVLKLCGVIDWSWWWVLAPTWIAIALAVIVIGFVWIVSGEFSRWRKGD